MDEHGVTQTEAQPPAHLVEEHAHPGPAEYIKVAVILGIVTALEVSVIYVDSLRPFWAPLLLSMMALKFALVGLWFMHLKFDSRLFRRLFISGIILAMTVYAVVLLTFGLLLD